MTVAVDDAAPCPSITIFRRPALMWWPIGFTAGKPRLPPGLSRAQLDCGCLDEAEAALDRARSLGAGGMPLLQQQARLEQRRADVPALTITLLESQR